MEITRFLIILLIATVSALQNKTLTQRFQEHVRRVTEFTCGEPQKRAIPVSTLTNLPSHEKYFPEITVLHRCDRQTGRCGQGEGFVCAPSIIEEVELVFHVEPISLGVSKKPKKRFQTVMAQNHTLCECRKVTDMPK